MATVKHLSFAGITLPLATPELEEWLSQVHPQGTFVDFSPWNFDGFDLRDLPTPPLPKIPEFQLGVLHWPTGASRPAWFHAVVNGTILSQIRTAVGDPMVPRPLVMYDGRTGQTITAQMYLLPARPLNQLGHDISDGYVLTLTDQRFFWPWRRGVIATQPASWTALYASLASILGVTITADTISANYATPSRKWIGYYRPTPAVLDSVATQIGQRVVCGLDGTVRTVNWPTAKGSSDAQRAVFTRKVSGGFIPTVPDIACYVPSSVKVLFASGSGQFFFASGGCCSEITPPYTVDKFLFPLQISQYGQASGYPYASAVVFGDLPFDGTNSTAVSNYATEAASAWYGWRCEEPEIVYPGIETWQPTGWEDYVEWTMQKREEQPFATTLVRRNEWNEFVSGSWSAGLIQQSGAVPSPPPPPPPPGSCGWVAGFASTDCLELTVEGAFGACSTINQSQDVILTYATGSGKWCSNATGVSWPGPGSPGQACFSISNCIPSLTFGSHCLFYMGCDDGSLQFSGGGSLCTGTAVECNNYFLVDLSCTCCAIPGWGGAGWYCVGNCTTVVELIGSDRCNNAITICTGPYPSESAAVVACVATTPTYWTADCCNTGVVAPLNTWTRFDQTFSGTGTLSFDRCVHFTVTQNTAYKIETIYSPGYSSPPQQAGCGFLGIAACDGSHGVAYTGGPTPGVIDCVNYTTAPGQTSIRVTATFNWTCPFFSCTVPLYTLVRVTAGSC